MDHNVSLFFTTDLRFKTWTDVFSLSIGRTGKRSRISTIDFVDVLAYLFAAVTVGLSVGRGTRRITSAMFLIARNMGDAFGVLSYGYRSLAGH